MSEELIWQTRDEMPVPTNPLQELTEILSRTSSDLSEDKMIACIFGIVCGWDDKSYVELKNKHNWTDEQIERQKFLHENYKRTWNLFMKDENENKNTDKKGTDYF